VLPERGRITGSRRPDEGVAGSCACRDGRHDVLMRCVFLLLHAIVASPTSHSDGAA